MTFSVNGKIALENVSRKKLSKLGRFTQKDREFSKFQVKSKKSNFFDLKLFLNQNSDVRDPMDA